MSGIGKSANEKAREIITDLNLKFRFQNYNPMRAVGYIDGYNDALDECIERIRESFDV